MKRLKLNRPCIVTALFLVFIFAFTGSVDALDIVLEPTNVQREVGGKVRLHIYADNAVGLISMGVKVSFDPSVLQILSASKYEDVEQGWVMDADGDSATTDDQYTTPPVEIDNTNGSVFMIGGRLTGSSTQGLSGKVLLGWIVFEAIGNGVSPLNVDRGKYHPEHPNKTFVNFATIDQSVDEPINVPADLGIICVMDGACRADIDGNHYVNMVDFAIMRASMGTSYTSSNYNVAADINANGYVEMTDFAILRSEIGSSCPLCQ